MADEAPTGPARGPAKGPEIEVNLFDPEVASCPHATYRRLTEGFPVGRQVMTNGPILSRYEDVVWALRHPEIFSSEMELQMALGTERPMIPQQVDPPAQTRYRKILDPRFSRRRMAEIAPDVRRHANELIDAFCAAGACEANQAFAVPLPCTAFLTLMGLPQEELAYFVRLKDGIIRPHTLVDELDFEKIQALRVQTGRDIYAYFDRVIAERRVRPGDDMLSYLLEAEIDGSKLSHNEILDVSFLLILAGLDTVTATIGCNLAFLAANPEQRQRLVADPARIPGAVEELLRWETPVTGVPRVVKQDTTVHGIRLEKGELVTLLLGASNLDDAEFDAALQVDFERERNRHIAFGAGPHRCLGSHLARMELEVALEVWHERIPDYGIQPGETPRFSPGIREVQHLPLVWDAA